MIFNSDITLTHYGADMSITVKQLMRVLEGIQNKFLEVEVAVVDRESLTPEIEFVRVAEKKVLIFLKRDMTK